ncbi:hypothetical protein XaFJ1_GM002296 [Xanthomonas albilineans]|nr:hypothetical protein XaFJ1_GM002296 [Xanthomonas albilineans]
MSASTSISTFDAGRHQRVMPATMPLPPRPRTRKLR